MAITGFVTLWENIFFETLNFLKLNNFKLHKIKIPSYKVHFLDNLFNHVQIRFLLFKIMKLERNFDNPFRQYSTLSSFLKNYEPVLT